MDDLHKLSQELSKLMDNMILLKNRIDRPNPDDTTMDAPVLWEKQYFHMVGYARILAERLYGGLAEMGD